MHLLGDFLFGSAHGGHWEKANLLVLEPRAIASNAFTTKVAGCYDRSGQKCIVTLMIPFLWPLFVLIYRKSAPSPFLLLVSANPWLSQQVQLIGWKVNSPRKEVQWQTVESTLPPQMQSWETLSLTPHTLERRCLRKRAGMLFVEKNPPEASWRSHIKNSNNTSSLAKT